MNGKCFDIGVIQTFVDGELGAAAAEKLVRHLSVCDKCTDLTAELESENELAFGVMDQEFNVLVPTERLRTKVFASIKEIESFESAGFWTRISAALGLTGLAARPGVAAFAAVLLFAAFAAVGFRVMNPSGPVGADDIANADRQAVVQGAADEPNPSIQTPENSVTASNEIAPGDTLLDIPAVDRADRAPVRAMTASHREVPRRRNSVPSARRARNVARAVAPAAPSPELDAEDGYLRTIATLNRTVDENKDYVLRPSERVAYERDLAVVDDAIKKMKGEVRQNPRNTAAREVLRSSYKSKIDLLSSVADRAETVASLD